MLIISKIYVEVSFRPLLLLELGRMVAVVVSSSAFLPFVSFQFYSYVICNQFS